MSGLQQKLEQVFKDHHDSQTAASIEHLQNMISINHRAVMDQSNKLNALRSRLEIETSEGMETIESEDLKALAESLNEEVETAVKLCTEVKEEFNQFEAQFVSA
jgi:hypothetical protein